MAFTIDSAAQDGYVVLSVRGDVDISTAPQLRSTLVEAVQQHATVIVDLDGVGFMDSTGLGVLVASRNRAGSVGHRLVVARPQRVVKNALRLIQIDTVIDVFDTLDDAVAAV